MYKLLVVAAAMLGAGCASLPDVSYRYFGAQASTSVKLVRTIVCDRNSRIVEVNAPLVTTSYAADPGKQHALELATLRGTFVDSEVKIEWYGDGRLKSLNQASSGQGEPILKAAIGVVAAAAGAPVGGAAALARTPECQLVDMLGRGKPISISYRPEPLVVDGRPTGLGHDVGPRRLLVPKDDYDRFVHERLKGLLKVLYVKVESVTPNAPLAQFVQPASESARQVAITLYHTSTVTYVFSAEVAEANRTSTEVFAQDTAIIPTARAYELPIPRPALFGKQSFALALSESGQISSSGYTSSSGAAGVLGVAGAAQAVTRGKTAAERAAQDEAEADLIAQQQRLLRCRTTPETCS